MIEIRGNGPASRKAAGGAARLRLHRGFGLVENADERLAAGPRVRGIILDFERELPRRAERNCGIHDLPL